MKRHRSDPRRRGALGLVLAAAVTSCTQFRTVLRDFDRIAGIEADAIPARLDYPSGLETWSATHAETIPDEALENPSGFARGRIIAMVTKARGNRLSVCRALHRLLVVCEADPSVLNRIEAYEGACELLGQLGAHPLQVLQSVDLGDPRERTGRVLAAFRELGHARRVTNPLSTDDAQRWAEALRLSGVGAMASARDGREALRMLIDDVDAATDPAERAEVLAAAERVAELEAARTLFQGLGAPDARLREAAATVIYQASGPEVLPMVLATSSRRGPGGVHVYAPTVRERRNLLRLCSQVSGEILFTPAFEGTPRPIDFIYDTVSRDSDEGLQMLALETMSRCLGRPVSFDRAWADRWWREFALRGGQ